MKNLIRFGFCLSLLLVVFGFTSTPETSIIGKYGVCATDPAKIELQLAADKTFTYRDFSNRAKPIDVQGNWELKGDKVLLKNYSSLYSFHHKWRISADGRHAYSRHGLNFYSLVRLND